MANRCNVAEFNSSSQWPVSSRQQNDCHSEERSDEEPAVAGKWKPETGNYRRLATGAGYNGLMADGRTPRLTETVKAAG
jgi:hypothetical protein